MHRLVAFALIALVIGLTPAMAQSPQPQSAPGQSAPGQSAPGQPQPGRPGAQPAKTGECAQLPGGKAPVARLAEVTTPLSPRSLDLIYFGKRLGDLSKADFERIAALSDKCGPGEGILSQDKLQKLEAVIREAQKARNGTISWAKERMAEVTALPVGRERLVRLNQLWTELEAREGDMTREDVDGFAAWIAREQQVLYDTASPPRPAPSAPMAAVPPASGAPAAAASQPDNRAPAPRPGPPAARSRKPGGEEE